MALNLGENFKQRWLTTPESVRQTYCEELQHLTLLLEPNTQIQKWQYQDHVLRQQHKTLIQKTYAEIKQQILTEQKRRKQQALLDSIAEKRALEQEKIDALAVQEKNQQQQQLQYLQQFAEQLQQQNHQVTSNIHKFDAQLAMNFDHGEKISPPKNTDNNINNDNASLADIRLRLELEAEEFIEKTVAQLRHKLQTAAQEEIQYLLSHLPKT